jgi:hypothetical protein
VAVIAFVTTIGEPTTDLCVWSLKRNGFEVHTVSGDTTLAEKLKEIYQEAYYIDCDFLRVDADVIVNKNCTPDNISGLVSDDDWWVQFMTFEWFRLDIGYGGVQFYKKETLPALMKNIDDALLLDRPETYLSRIPEFYGPRRFNSVEKVMGLHNYKNDIKRVAKVKANRGQSSQYDFDLAVRMNEL